MKSPVCSKTNRKVGGGGWPFFGLVRMGFPPWGGCSEGGFLVQAQAESLSAIQLSLGVKVAGPETTLTQACRG